MRCTLQSMILGKKTNNGISITYILQFEEDSNLVNEYSYNKGILCVWFNFFISMNVCVVLFKLFEI